MTFRESAPARAALVALVGAIAFGVVLIVAYGRQGPAPRISDRGFATPATGIYPVERADGVLYAWTGPSATLVIPGIDRALSWRLRTNAHNSSVTHGGDGIAARVHPATAYGPVCNTTGMPMTVTAGLSAVGVASPRCEHVIIAPS